MKQKVVVIGHGYTSRLGVIRALGLAGYDVTVIVIESTSQHKRPIDCYSKYVDGVLYCIRDESTLLTLLLSKCSEKDQKPVLFPDSDFAAYVIDSHIDELAKSFVFPHVRHTSGAVVKWMDKVRQKQLAKSVGLNVADSVKIEKIDGKYSIPRGVLYPCFTKAMTFTKSPKHLLKRCESEEELRGWLDKLAEKTDAPIIIEEYKTIQEEYAVLGFSNGDDVVIPGIIHMLQNAHGGHFGVTSMGMVSPISEKAELIEQFKTFVREVGYVGVFDIDFYKADEKYFFCEMNLRIGGSCYAITKSGVNLPAMMVRTLCGEGISDMNRSVEKESTFVNDRMCMDDWYGGFISTRQLKNLMVSADISFIKDNDDPEPFKAFKKDYRRMYIKRLVRLLLHYK